MSERLVLLPGLLCDQELWAGQIAGLAGDALVPELTRQGSIEGMAERVLSEAPPRFDLAGFSMGGYVAQQVVRLAPERVRRLALIDTSARADTREQSSRRRQLVELARREGVREAAKQLIPLLLAPARRDGELASRTVAMAARVGAATFARQQKAIEGRPDLRAELRTIGCPTLVLCGELDRLTPPRLSEELVGLLPDARLTVLRGSAHMTPLEDPDAVTTALAEWLRLAERSRKDTTAA
jgi:pimeloyl-ACP methyl ester carboxylesterase